MGTGPRVVGAAELRALAWLERASQPVSTLGDPAVIGELLDALSRKLDGTPAASGYFSRRRRVMHRVLSYAVLKRRLSGNPPSKLNLPEGWSAPPAPEDIVDPRSVGGAGLVADMLTVTSYIGHRQGLRFVAFYGCMFYAISAPARTGGCSAARTASRSTSPPKIAAWAGHSVEMLLRVYARCVAGLEDVWIARLDASLRFPAGPQENDEQASGPDARPAGGSEPADELVPDDDDREDQK